MNILLINHYAGSDRMGMEYRPFYLAREWAAKGHRVTLVAANFSHLRMNQPDIRGELEATEEDGVRFRWIRSNRYQGNGAARVASMLTFVGKLMAFADRIAREERPDIVICSSTYPLDIYPGARIARKAGARLVFEVHDLWPLTPVMLGGYSPSHPYIAFLQRAEDWAYRHADTVVSILPNTREHMLSRGLDPAKFMHVPNGIPVAALLGHGGDTALPPAVAERIGRERARGRFLVGYAGGLNLSNAVGALLDTARLMAGEDVSFLLAGDGAEARSLKASAERDGLDNFHLMGRIPKRTVQTFLAEMDALVILWHRNPLYRFGVSPNKMFDYMLAGKPIVQACEASNDLVADAGCGLTVPPERPEAVADAIRGLSALPLPERERLGANGRSYVHRHHDYQVLAADFLDAVTPKWRPAPASTLEHAR